MTRTPAGDSSANAGLSKGDRTRRYIKDTIIRLFLKKTYTQITLGDICREAGLTSGAFYFHFRNKDEALYEISCELLEEFYRVFEKTGDRKDLKSLIHTFLLQLYEGYNAKNNTMRAMVTVIPVWPKLYNFWLKVRLPVEHALEAAVADERRRLGLELGGEAVLAHLFLSSAENFFHDVYMTNNKRLRGAANSFDFMVSQQAVIWYTALTCPGLTRPDAASPKPPKRGG